MNTKPNATFKEKLQGCVVLIFVILVMTCFAILCEDEKPNQYKPKYTKEYTLKALTQALHESVETYLNQNLNDASSYEPVSWYEPVKLFNDAYTIRHKYRAKNALGAYVLSDYFFVVDRNGNVESVQIP